MNIPSFSISGLPRIVFGDGVISRVPALAAEFGHQALLLTGAKSFVQSPQWAALTNGLKTAGISFEHATIGGEPSPELVDELAARFHKDNIEVVIGIGGGSVLDAAKAVAGLLHIENSVMDYLEGVGPELPYQGPEVPFIAVPTTAGTGSEATKNAVLSRHGLDGFKKSFRHEKLVPRYAVVDPELLAGCPKNLIAANGMDAFTQLLESYVSIRGNPITDALAMSGMRAVCDSLIGWHNDEGDVAAHRANMAYGALLSGITLAQVGLGSVHGLAAPLGAFFPMPHGVVCGTLVAECTRANLRALQARDQGSHAIWRPSSSNALWRYAHVGKVMANNMKLSEQNGLGSVHGLAAPLGAFFPIPHGVVCGTLVAECTRANLRALQARDQGSHAIWRPSSSNALWRYAHVGKVMANNMKLSEQDGLDTLVEVLEGWTQSLKLPRLSSYGMAESDIPRVVANCRGSSMKTNPVVLTDDEVGEILLNRL